jgi:hypothetical protein
MSRKIDEFKEFVKAHPSIKNVIDTKEKTWQTFWFAMFFYIGSAKAAKAAPMRQLFSTWVMVQPMS